MITLTALLGNIWVRRAALAVGIAIALLAVRQHYINLGKTQGAENMAQQGANQITQNTAQQRDTAVAQITQLNQQILVIQQQLSGQQQILLALIQQRQQATQQVQGMTPQQVADALNQALGKPQGSTDFTIDDKRKALDCFDQLPLCQKQTNVQDGIIQDLHSQQDKQDQRYTALGTYTTDVEQAYTSLYNLKSEPRRSVKCLWLWHCSRPHIKSPNPADLLQRPK